MSRTIPKLKVAKVGCRRFVAYSWSCLLLVMVLPAPVGVSAAEWTNNISGGLRQTYTDNTDLTDDNAKSEWITSVTPGISVNGEGARLSLGFYYGFNFNHHTGDRDTSVNQRMQANANAELADQWLFLDARSTATQTLIDQFQGSGGDAVNNTGNTENTFTWEVSPYTRHRLGRYAEAGTRVSYNEVRNSTSSDSKGVRANANLRSGQMFPDFPWWVDYRYEKDFSYGGGETSSRSHVLDGTVQYVINRIWRIEGGVGREWNDFESNRQDNDGMRWSANVIWTPSERTLLNVGYSDRFYGSYPTLDFSHRSRRSILTANYSRELSNPRQLRLENEVFATEDAFGNPIVDPVTGDPLEVNEDLADSTADIFVNEVFQSSYSIQTRRTTATVNFRRRERRYQDSGRDNTTSTVSLSVSRAFSGVTSSTADLSWSRYQDERNPEQAQNREHDTWSAGLGLTHTLTERTNIAFDYRFRHRDSDVDNDNYTENRVGLSLTSSW